MEEEDPKEEPVEEETTLIEEDNLRKELVGTEDNGVEPGEGRSEPKTTLFPWRRGRCGRICRGKCPLEAPD